MNREKGKKFSHLLSKSEISTVFDLSKKKVGIVNTDCNNIFTEQIEELGLNKEEEELIHQVYIDILNEKDKKRKQVLNNDMHKTGFQVKDPYFKACLKPLTPFVVYAYFRNGVTTNQLRSQYNTYAINESLEDLLGRMPYVFKKRFYRHGANYDKKLKKRGLIEKMGVSYNGDKGEPSNRHIPLSWIADLLDSVNKTAKNHGYMNLQNNR